MAYRFALLVAYVTIVNAGYIGEPQQHVTYVTSGDSHSHQYHHEEPALVKDVSYAVPTKVVHSEPTHYEYISSAGQQDHYNQHVTKHLAVPVVSKTISYSAPVAKTITYKSEPMYQHHEPYAAQPQYHHEAPVYTQKYITPVIKSLESYNKSPSSHVGQHYTTTLHNPSQGKVVYTPVQQSHTLAIAKPVQHTQIAYAPEHISYEKPIIGHLHQSQHEVPVTHTHQHTYSKIVEEPHYQQHHHYNTAPVYAEKTVAAVSYSPASAVSHAEFHGHGTEYHW